MVAAIRALADFIEERTDLPVPNSVHAQYSLIGADPANEDVVRDVAAKLDAKPVITADCARVGIEIARFPASVDYVVHGFTDGGVA
jgi:hypothetical protein